MTDAAAYGSGYLPSSASTSRANSGRQESAGPDDAERFGASASPGHGAVASWPEWPGAARPAGWFLPVPGEAAPPAGPGTEPARAETGDQADDAGDPDPAGDVVRDQDAGDAAADEVTQPGEYEPDDYWYPSPLPASWQMPGAGIWQPAQPGYYAEPPTTVDPAGPAAPVVGPTAALRGRAGGPGFEGAPGEDTSSRSGWQLAHGMWRGSGIQWEEPAPGPAAAPPVPAPPVPAPPEPAGQAFAAAPTMADSPTRIDGPAIAGARYDDTPTRIDGPAVADLPADAGSRSPFARVPAAYPQSAFHAAPVYAGSSAYGAPTAYAGAADAYAGAPDADAPDADAYADAFAGGEPDWTRPEAIQATRVRTEEADERFRAWHDSVRAAATPRATRVRRRAGWQLAHVGVPAVIIVIVGAGAFMLLTGKSGEILGNRADQSAHVPGSSRQGGASAFGGYPGQHGTVTVSSFASSGGTQLAVGGADGHPAIWRRDAGSGRWTLISAGQPAVSQLPGSADFTSVAVGRAGWIAVGGSAGGHPVLVTSPDGATWRAMSGTGAFAGPGLTVSAATAGRDGYVLVGQQVTGSRRFAAMWWSSDLRDWTRGYNGHLIGTIPSSVHAVTAAGTGFVGAGEHGGQPAVWISTAGQSWAPINLPPPGGAASAALRFAAANGRTVVTAGEADTGHGTVPFVATSADGGQNWREIMLPATGGGTVTGLTASGPGFSAAGRTGQDAVTWSSPDGVTWSAAAPAGSGS